jgi:hypothetical protein
VAAQKSELEQLKKLGEKQAQIQSQQAIQPGGESPCYIDQNIDCPPVFEGLSQGGTQLTVEPAAAQKSEIEQLKKLGEKQAQIQSQQAIQPGGESPCYIDQNIDCPPVFEGLSQRDSQLTVEAAAEQKSELEQLVEALPFAETVEDFSLIVEGSSLEAVEEAIALSGSQPRRQQLTAWYEAIQQLASGEFSQQQWEVIAAHSSPAWHEKAKAYGELLLEGIACGLETVKALVQPWSQYERWAAIFKAEELSPEAMEKLHQIKSNWADLCVAW